MNQIEIIAKDLESAYKQAAKKLECSVTELNIEVVQYPKAGFLGLFAKSAIIKASAKRRENRDFREKKGRSERNFERNLERGEKNLRENRSENRENLGQNRSENIETRAQNREILAQNRPENRQNPPKEQKSKIPNIEGGYFADNSDKNGDFDRNLNRNGKNLGANFSDKRAQNLSEKFGENFAKNGENLSQNQQNSNQNFNQKQNFNDSHAKNTTPKTPNFGENTQNFTPQNLGENSKNFSQNQNNRQNFNAQNQQNLETNFGDNSQNFAHNHAPQNFKSQNSQNQTEQIFDENFTQTATQNNFFQNSQNFTTAQTAQNQKFAQTPPNAQKSRFGIDDAIFDSFHKGDNQKPQKSEITDEILAQINADIVRLFSQSCYEIAVSEVSKYNEETIFIRLDGNDAALIIGKEGYRYKAVSYLLFNWINIKFGLNVRLEVAEFLKNQELGVATYLQSVIERVELVGKAQTKPLDGVLVKIALEQLRARFPNKYVAIKNDESGRYIVINDFRKR